MSTAFKILAFMAILILIAPSSGLAGDHTISTTVELSSSAINRFLNTQYNETGFPRSFNVTQNGTTYTISLTLPEIILTPDNAEIRMIFDVNTGTINVYHFEVDPSIDIPQGQITEPQVQAFLTNLPTVLNNVTFIPQWVRNGIIQYYNSFGFDVYPSKLIDQVNTNWFSQRAINVVSPYFSLGWQVSQDLLTFVISIYLNSQSPDFQTALLDPSSGDDLVFFKSNIQVTVKEVLVVSTGGGNIYYHGYPNTLCSKGGIVNIDMGLLNLGTLNTYTVRAVYKIDNTWFCGEYGWVIVNATDGNGHQLFFGATKKENF